MAVETVRILPRWVVRPNCRGRCMSAGANTKLIAMLPYDVRMKV